MSDWFYYIAFGFGIISIIMVVILYFQIRKYERLTNQTKRKGWWDEPYNKSSNKEKIALLALSILVGASTASLVLWGLMR